MNSGRSPENMEWKLKRFKQFALDELYELLKLRVDVFVVGNTIFSASDPLRMITNLKNHS